MLGHFLIPLFQRKSDQEGAKGATYCKSLVVSLPADVVSSCSELTFEFRTECQQLFSSHNFTICPLLPMRQTKDQIKCPVCDLGQFFDLPGLLDL